MKNKPFDTSSESQRARLLEWLKKRPISTIEARHRLDILGVAPRIFELRHWFGYNIKTHFVNDSNPGGGRHRVGHYILFPGLWQEEKQ